MSLDPLVNASFASSPFPVVEPLKEELQGEGLGRTWSTEFKMPLSIEGLVAVSAPFEDKEAVPRPSLRERVTTHLSSIAEKIADWFHSLTSFFRRAVPVPPSQAAHGIDNYGNFCYINSSMQALLAHPRLGEHIDHPLTQKDGENDDSFQRRLQVQQAAKGFYEAYSKGADSYTLFTHIQTLRDCVFAASENPDFIAEPEDQHDAGIFLNALFEALEIGFVQQDHREPITNGLEFQSQPKLKQNPLLQVDFQPGCTSLQQLIGHRASEEKHDPDNALKIEVDGGMWTYEVDDYVIKTQILDAPDLLVLQLKRYACVENPAFKSDKNAPPYISHKIDTCVTFPKSNVLDLRSLMPGERAFYRPVGFVKQHHGDLNGGHYVAHAKRGDRWHDFNDSGVTPLKRDEVDRGGAYLIVLERVEPRLGSHRTARAQ